MPRPQLLQVLLLVRALGIPAQKDLGKCEVLPMATEWGTPPPALGTRLAGSRSEQQAGKTHPIFMTQMC